MILNIFSLDRYYSIRFIGVTLAMLLLLKATYGRCAENVAAVYGRNVFNRIVSFYTKKFLTGS